MERNSSAGKPTATIPVGAREGYQVEGLGEAGPGRDGAALAALHGGDVPAELRVDHGDLAVLDDVTLYATHRLPRVVRHNDVGGNLLPVVVRLAVQGHLQVDLAIAEGEALAHQGAGQAAASGGRGVLQLKGTISHQDMYE